MPSTLLTSSHALVAILLIAAILLQNRGAGLGETFGGDSGIYHTKRGMEKRLHQATIVLAAAFVVLSVLSFIL